MIDEVANGLSYYDYTFFRELPRLYGAIEDELDAIQARRETASRSLRSCASAPGSAATATATRLSPPSVLNEAVRLQSARALSHYLDELHELGGEFSLAGTLVRSATELIALADRSADPSPTRRDEPYRRAITGIYSRLAKTARDLDHVDGAAPADLTDARALCERRGIRRRSRHHRPVAESARRRRSWRAGACARCGARSTCSASISRRST